MSWDPLTLVGAGLLVSFAVSVTIGRILRRVNRHYPSPAKPPTARVREWLGIGGDR